MLLNNRQQLFLVAAIAVLCGQSPQDAPPATRPATQPSSQPATQAAEPADEVLQRLLETGRTGRPATEQPLSGDRFAGGLNNAAGGGSASVAPDTPAQRLVREGTYVIDRVGRARPSADDRGIEFVFDADGEQRAAAVDPPMLLLPSLNLVAVESAMRVEPDRRFRVTGRVTEYRGRNYLLLEKVVVVQ